MFIRMKQAKKNSFKMLPSIWSRASCAIFVLYLESITWRRPFLYSLPVCQCGQRFFFSFLFHVFVTLYMQCPLFKKLQKSVRLSSCQNVWFCYCTEINIVINVLYTKQRICGVPGVGNCLFLRAWGWGIDHQVRAKLQIPRGYAWGGMVTGRIEPCIKLPHLSSRQFIATIRSFIQRFIRT